MKLSIIVPVYNVEEYLERCVRSLEDQDLAKDEYEIIVVNDGSPDNSKQLIEKLQAEFSNIILIDQENQGVSMARNNAIERATGEYILPIDPDDYVLPNTLAHLYNKAHTLQVDVLFAGFEIFDRDGASEWKTQYQVQAKEVWSGVDAYFAARGPRVKDPDRSWGILFCRSFLKETEVDYPRDVPYLEDGLFVGKVFSVANRVGFDNEVFYQRTTRPGSATHSSLIKTKKGLDGFLVAIQDVDLFLTKLNHSEQSRQLLNHLKAKFILLPLTITISNHRWLGYFKIIFSLRKLGVEKIDCAGVRSVYLEYARAFNRSSVLFPYFYFKITKKNV
ncbi:MAG: glycosyltransferase [Imperialibacter sp.]|uniref:glycosyltransferase family 2 protein n=1 Tax=Imperialibacter sp. TaxID=2038411 RepID=UPI0032EC5A2D